MKRIAAATLLLLAGSGVAWGNPGPCGFGYGCGGFCLRLFPHMHQHGPLFNYGPYYGYPPFEPYGYWNAYLQYTGPVGANGNGGYGCNNCGNRGCFKCGQGNPNPLRGRRNTGDDCSPDGCSKGVLNGSILHGGLGGHHHRKKQECTSCGTIAAAEIEAGPVFDRYSGFGNPATAAAYYANTPGLTDPEAVMPAAFRSK